MYEQLLSRSERCIEQQPDRQLTISALWDKMKSMASKDHFVIPDTMSDFECLLEGDKRFRFSEMKGAEEDHTELEIIDKEFPELDEIEGLGFDHEQQVTLTRFMREDDTDEPEDEAFAPRPFRKDEDGVERTPLTASKKTAATRVKKPAPKKSSPKRK